MDRYQQSVRVQSQQPYQLRTYTWCWALPPKCSRYKIVMKTIFKTEVSPLQLESYHNVVLVTEVTLFITSLAVRDMERTVGIHADAKARPDTLSLQRSISVHVIQTWVKVQGHDI